MPSASDGLRALMARWFPTCLMGGYPNTNGTDDGAPAHFLFVRGWTEENGIWRKPTPSHTPSIYEEACLIFLRDEWDYDFEKPLYGGFDYNTGEEIK